MHEYLCREVVRVIADAMNRDHVGLSVDEIHDAVYGRADEESREKIKEISVYNTLRFLTKRGYVEGRAGANDAFLYFPGSRTAAELDKALDRNEAIQKATQQKPKQREPFVPF